MKYFLSCLVWLISSISSVVAQETMPCRLLSTFVAKGGVFDHQNTSKDIILIDTFYFFSETCSGSFGEKNIVVVNKVPENYKRISKNFFFVGGIATGRNESLAISIFHPYGNYQMVHYFSIFGNKIKVIKKSSGNF